jgi:hypothetical protein
LRPGWAWPPTFLYRRDARPAEVSAGLPFRLANTLTALAERSRLLQVLMRSHNLLLRILDQEARLLQNPHEMTRLRRNEKH